MKQIDIKVVGTIRLFLFGNKVQVYDSKSMVHEEHGEQQHCIEQAVAWINKNYTIIPEVM